MSAVGALLAVAAMAAGAPTDDATFTIDRAGAGPLDGRVITIDPGHNGANGSHPDEISEQVPIGGGETKECDTAGTTTNSGYSEAKYTLNVARRMTTILESKGAKVVLTRKNNHGVGPCINERARIGNRVNSDAVVSIHADGGPSSGRGFHVIYPSKIRGLTDDIYRPSNRLAKRLRGAYERGTGLPPATYLDGDGLDERSDLGGLRLSNVPKVFIETANMRNATDARKLESRSFRERIAGSIASGLSKYLRR